MSPPGVFTAKSRFVPCLIERRSATSLQICDTRAFLMAALELLAGSAIVSFEGNPNGSASEE